jgi:hypothetical protein
VFISPKKSVGISISLLYILAICFLYSGSLIDRFQEARYEKQILKKHLATTKIFSLKEWNNFPNKKEIKIKKNYYDIVSYKILQNIVITKLIKDTDESKIRVTLTFLFTKTKFPHNKHRTELDKFKVVLCSVYQIQSNSFLKPNTNIFDKIKINRYKNLYYSIYKPPC